MFIRRTAFQTSKLSLTVVPLYYKFKHQIFLTVYKNMDTLKSFLGSRVLIKTKSNSESHIAELYTGFDLTGYDWLYS